MSSPIVELRNVSKTFRGRGVVTALANVSFQLQAGERVAVVGRSGSGKSTLLAISGSLERASGGDVLIQGQRLSDLPDRAIARLRGQRIGFVFQSFHLLQRLTALENVAEALMYGGVRGPQREAQAAALLERLGLGARASHYPHQLSGGEQQRVAIARAIANEPALLIADEPTGDLDPESGREVVSALLESGESRAVLVATHVPEVAARLERQLRLVGGRLIADDG